MEEDSGIYKITSPSGKVYIGQSIDVKRRLNKYKSSITKFQIKLFNSFKKYGVDNHQFDIIEYCSVDKLNESERFWQDVFDSVKNGLNCKLTLVDGRSGYLCEETKKKMSDAKKNIFNGSDNPMFGKSHNENTKLKMRNKKLGKKLNQNHIDNLKKSGKSGKLVSDLSTGIFYKSCAEASKTYNIIESTLRSKLNGSLNNNTNLIYI